MNTTKKEISDELKEFINYELMNGSWFHDGNEEMKGPANFLLNKGLTEEEIKIHLTIVVNIIKNEYGD